MTDENRNSLENEDFSTESSSPIDGGTNFVDDFATSDDPSTGSPSSPSSDYSSETPSNGEGALPSDPSHGELTHCKVPFAPWISETFVFFRRYFWRRILWIGLVSLAINSLFLFFTLPLIFDLDDIDDILEEACVSDVETVQNEGKKDDWKPFVEGATNPVEREKISSEVTDLIFMILPLILFLVVIIWNLSIDHWCLRTIQTGVPSWKHLALKSFWTVPKFIVGTIFLLISLGFFYMGGILLGVTFIKESPDFLVLIYFTLLFIGIGYLYLRFGGFFWFILDRNSGPLKSLKESRLFTKKNIVVFLCGVFFVTGFVIGISFFIVPFFFVISSIPKSPTLDEILFISLGPVIHNIIFIPLLRGMFAVFYLMMTGQERPGVCPIENVKG